MTILPVVSTKGGAGKSTQAANLAGFTADAGLKTLLIDGDHAQPTASNIFSLDYEAPCGLYEFLTLTADFQQSEQLISKTSITGLHLIISNDPPEQLKTLMPYAPDDRLRMRNVLQHALFQDYHVVIIDSQGARSVMLEMIVLAATDTVMGMVKPFLPDVREFIRGTIHMLETLSALYTLQRRSLRRLTSVGSDHFPIMLKLVYSPKQGTQQESPEKNSEDEVLAGHCNTLCKE